jgi:hypothetical protein
MAGFETECRALVTNLAWSCVHSLPPFNREGFQKTVAETPPFFFSKKTRLHYARLPVFCKESYIAVI